LGVRIRGGKKKQDAMKTALTKRRKGNSERRWETNRHKRRGELNLPDKKEGTGCKRRKERGTHTEERMGKNHQKRTSNFRAAIIGNTDHPGGKKTEEKQKPHRKERVKTRGQKRLPGKEKPRTGKRAGLHNAAKKNEQPQEEK